jgi:tetratricopeptide (TPR) repeat protein
LEESVRTGSPKLNAREKEFKAALQAAPNDPAVHEWFGAYLSRLGRFAEAVEELKRAKELSTRSHRLSVSIRMLLGGAYAGMGQHDLAVAELESVIALETNRPTAYLALAGVYEGRGEFAKAIDLRETWNRLTGAEDLATASRRYAQLREAVAREGSRGYWQRSAEWARQEQDDASLARACAQLKNLDQAFPALWNAFQSDRGWLACAILSDSALAPLRSDPRYDELLRAMKLR